MKHLLLKIKDTDLLYKAIDISESLGYKVYASCDYGIFRSSVKESRMVNNNDHSDCVGLSFNMDIIANWSNDRDLKIRSVFNDWEESVNKYCVSISAVSAYDWNQRWTFQRRYRVRTEKKLIRLLSRYKKEFDKNIPIMRKKLIDTLNKYPNCKIGKKVIDQYGRNLYVKDYVYSMVNDGEWHIRTGVGSSAFGDLKYID